MSAKTKVSSSEILVFGDITVDIIGRVPAWPQPGDDCLAEALEMHCGGVGANCALGLARWGVRPRLVGCVGHDLFGEHVLGVLAKRGVDVRWVRRTRDAMTGMFYINVTPDGERTFFGSRGANALALRSRRPGEVGRGIAAAHLVGYNFLSPGTGNAARQLIEIVRKSGGWVSLDVGIGPSKMVPRRILQMCRSVDILLLSADEAAALTGTSDPFDAFAKLRIAGAREVVLKAGKRGCLILDDGRPVLVPSFSVRVVDSTGAGDAFVAAFLQARLRGWSAAEGAIVANAAGALAATVVGAGESLPGLWEVGALLRGRRLEGKWDAVRLRVLARLRAGKKNSGRPR
jgi:sugar/nucleoside kinase (ribokinase family)